MENELKPEQTLAAGEEVPETVPAAPPAEQSAVSAEAAEAPDPMPEILARLDRMQARLEAIEEATAGVSKQIGFIPPQVRQLGNRIDGLGTSIGDSRYRSLLLRLLAIHDLAGQMARAATDSEAAHHRNYEVLGTQLRQLLEINGLSEIPAEGMFDPAVHCAVERREVQDPDQANRILEVVRPGYRTEQSVLRYAEVLVGYYVPAPAPQEAPAGEPAA